MAETTRTEDAAASEDGSRSLLEDVFGLLPALAERTSSQIQFSRSVLSMLPCTGSFFEPDANDQADVPEHEARQPTDVLSLLSREDTDGDGSDESGSAPGTAEAPMVTVGEAAPGSVRGSGHSSKTPAASDLAIPSYDSLAASQVVPRLTTLSSKELAAVEAYEAAHRGRRTILNRVTQLLAK